MTDDPARDVPESEPPVTWETYIAYITAFLHERIAAGKTIREPWKR